MVAGHSTLSKGNSRRSELNGALIYRRYRILDEADIERALEKTQESIKRQRPTATWRAWIKRVGAEPEAPPAQIPHNELTWEPHRLANARYLVRLAGIEPATLGLEVRERR